MDLDFSWPAVNTDLLILHPRDMLLREKGVYI